MWGSVLGCRGRCEEVCGGVGEVRKKVLMCEKLGCWGVGEVRRGVWEMC